MRLSKIVIDAGHGGKDPGAIGARSKEKDNVLKIALKLKPLLESYGHKVILTRANDVYPTLTERTNMANRVNADYFVSLHNNSATSTQATGFETFIYNGNVSNKTKELQNAIHNAISKKIGIKDRGKKRANFAVLRQTKMPAVLIEYAFIRNLNDEKILIEQVDNLAQWTCDGIVNLLGGTKKTNETTSKNQTFYKIQNGDTLYSIAQKHDTTVGEIERLNSISDINTIYVGDTLKLPSKASQTKSKPKASKTKGVIATIQDTLNKRYNFNIKVDDIFGKETKKALVMAFQIELNKQFGAGLVVDGIFGAKTRNASRNIRKGARGNLTWILQSMLYCLGYDLSVDGIFGNETERAVRNFQTKSGIAVDGVPGKNTFARLFA